MTELCHLFYH